jgi:hypothetical protein
VLDDAGDPVPDEAVTFTLGAKAPGTMKPTSGEVSTDENGVATVTFKAGKKEGTAVITAEAAGVNATLQIAVSNSDTPAVDPAANVQAFLEQAGYQVDYVGPFTDENGDPINTDIAVLMPRASETLDGDLGNQLINGWYALWVNYPDAETYWVVTTFDHYGVYWPVGNEELATFLTKSADGSLTDDENNAFWDARIGSITIIDFDTGEVVSDSKDFLDKNFGGGS